MANNRKKRGKVKRYRYQFYSKAAIAKKLAIWAVVLAVLGGLGYFVAPYIVNFGTSTWYSLIAPNEKQPETTPIPSATPMPTITPEPEPIEPTSEIVFGNFMEVSLSALTSDDLIVQAVDNLKKQDVKYALITLKDFSGYIHYASNVPNAASSVANSVVDVEKITQTMKENGIIPVADISAFRDPLSVYQDASMGIIYRGNNFMWLDNTKEAGGKAWMNPYSDTARTFIGDIIEELSTLGFNHFNLSFVEFPRQISVKQDFGDVGVVTRAEALQGAIETWKNRFSEDNIVLWFEYPYHICLEGDNSTGAPPVELGVENLVVYMHADAGIQAEEMEKSVEDLKAQGAQNVVVYDGTSGNFME